VKTQLNSHGDEIIMTEITLQSESLDALAETEVLVVENNGRDAQKVLNVYQAIKDDLGIIYGLKLEETPTFKDNARDALDFLRDGDTTNVLPLAVIDRDLEYFEVLINEDVIQAMERPSGSDRRDGVMFLSDVVYAHFQMEGYCRPIDVAAFYTAESTGVKEDSKFKDLSKYMATGKGPMIFVQQKGEDPTNEVGSLLEAGSIVHTVSKKGMFDEAPAPYEAADMRKTLARMVADTNFVPSDFIGLYEEFNDFIRAEGKYNPSTIANAYDDFQAQ
tara:strand:+ start:2474 stop:3298 length:825 start_codon:yes stop_codon:yes gene_type:complete